MKHILAPRPLSQLSSDWLPFTNRSLELSVFEAEIIRSALAFIFAGSYSTLRSSYLLCIISVRAHAIRWRMLAPMLQNGDDNKMKKVARLTWKSITATEK